MRSGDDDRRADHHVRRRRQAHAARTLTDDAGATWTTTSTVDVHASNIPPIASLIASPMAPRPGQEVTLSAFGSDPDGEVVRYEFDFDGDGTYEVDGPQSSTTTTFTAGGTRTIGVRLTDRTAPGRQAGARSRSRRATTRRSSACTAPGSRAASRDGERPRRQRRQYAWDLNNDGVFQEQVGQYTNTASLPPDVYGDLKVAVRVTDKDGAATTEEYTLKLTRRSAGPAAPVRAAEPAARGAIRHRQRVHRRFRHRVVRMGPDGDGTFDPATTTPGVTASFAPGPHTVRVRATDARGRR